MKNRIISSFLMLSHIILFVFTNNLYSQDIKEKNKQLSADFEASVYEIIAGECIDFTDMSIGNPTYWNWEFPGSETLISNEQNPTNICYLEPGVYPVILEIQSATGYDLKYVEECIIVLDNNEFIVANFVADNRVIPVNQFVTFTDISLNDPVKWNWEFEGGFPSESELQNPFPVVYSEIGTYDVYLRVEDASGQQSEILRKDYITVISESTTHPIANFSANRTFIAPGESVKFTDLSKGSPYKWNWLFQGGEPETWNTQNPPNIFYDIEGSYDVRLIIRNSLGTDTVVKEDYIIVSYTDPCTDAPIPKFSASQTLIPISAKVNFVDESLNNPTSWYWTFEGAYPSSSTEANPVGIEYNIPGEYYVSLVATNNCGSNILVKQNKIIVYSGLVPKVCDTISNIFPNEPLVSTSLQGSWGHIGGHNGARTRVYADRFEQYAFSQIEGIVVPVHKVEHATHNARATLFIWDGNSQYPDSVLFQKDVYLRNITSNLNNFFKFEKPVEVDGPFFVGYRIYYNDITGNGQSDDIFVVNLAQNRNYSGAKNTLYVQHAGVWESATKKFGIKTSSGIKPIACVVEIPKLLADFNISIYPNPTSDFIKINTGDIIANKNINIQIYDITGKLVYNSIAKAFNDNITINTTNFNEGLYFINLMFDNFRITEKVIILH